MSSIGQGISNVNVSSSNSDHLAVRLDLIGQDLASIQFAGIGKPFSIDREKGVFLDSSKLVSTFTYLPGVVRESEKLLVSAISGTKVAKRVIYNNSEPGMYWSAEETQDLSAKFDQTLIGNCVYGKPSLGAKWGEKMEKGKGVVVDVEKLASVVKDNNPGNGRKNNKGKNVLQEGQKVKQRKEFRQKTIETNQDLGNIFFVLMDANGDQLQNGGFVECPDKGQCSLQNPLSEGMDQASWCLEKGKGVSLEQIGLIVVEVLVPSRDDEVSKKGVMMEGNGCSHEVNMAINVEEESVVDLSVQLQQGDDELNYEALNVGNKKIVQNMKGDLRDDQSTSMVLRELPMEGQE
ncbi:unnamed protein product [Ilex paraguariensis]|uniref:Uncharacterized protein n=1 Tax=Ilex paraguariensis TaxID=185542 RepID=A0ABC8TJQ1_9AQUA